MSASGKLATNPGVMISGSGGAPLSVEDIRNAIHDLDNDVEITFGATLAGVPLEFNRFKWRGDKLLQIELNEVETEQQNRIELDAMLRPKVKMFREGSISSMESAVNKWLDANQHVSVRQTQTSHALTSDGSGNQRASTVVSIWYDE